MLLVVWLQWGASESSKLKIATLSYHRISFLCVFLLRFMACLSCFCFLLHICGVLMMCLLSFLDLTSVCRLLLVGWLIRGWCYFFSTAFC